MRSLWLGNNNFYGSLEFLKNLSKLWRLDISDTDVSHGLEYLPESIEYFRCLIKERPEAKVKVIVNLLTNKRDEYIIDFSQKLQEYKQKLQGQNQQQAQILQPTNLPYGTPSSSK